MITKGTALSDKHKCFSLTVGWASCLRLLTIRHNFWENDLQMDTGSSMFLECFEQHTISQMSTASTPATQEATNNKISQSQSCYHAVVQGEDHFDDAEPDHQEVEEATGNAGASMERWESYLYVVLCWCYPVCILQFC